MKNKISLMGLLGLLGLLGLFTDNCFFDLGSSVSVCQSSPDEMFTKRKQGIQKRFLHGLVLYPAVVISTFVIPVSVFAFGFAITLARNSSVFPCQYEKSGDVR